MMTYILHPNLSLIRADDIQRNKTAFRFSDAVIQQIERSELFLLANQRLDALFVINPTIKLFLQEFTEKPRLFKDILMKWAIEANCALTEIEPVLKEFFDNMLDRNILVSQREVTKILRIKQREITATLNSGDILDQDFEILRPLSINGLIHVFLAKNSKTNTKVVLKVLALHDEINKKNSAFQIKNFNQELNLMQELKGHPNICQLLEIRQTTPIFAVLEYIEGETLQKIVTNNTLNFHQKIHIARQLIASVAALHQKKIIHGDIHLNNFLINSINYDVKLIDFDLANHQRPKRGEIVHEGGVHEYIAPEKIDGNSFDLIQERADYRSEVFQLGIVLYALFFGKLPFEALTWQELTEKIRFSEPPFLSDNTVPLPIIKLIKKCLDKNPKKRFKNACAVHKALDGVL